MSIRRVTINGAFLPQKVTGQQRYAREITARLRGREYLLREPAGRFRGSAIREWLWSLVVLPYLARWDYLLTLTARGPLWHPRQILVVHDLFVLTNPEWFSRKYSLTHAPTLQLQLRSARGVVAVSEPVAAQVRALVPRAEVVVAPNAPSEAFAASAPRSPEILERLGLPTGGFFLCVGSLDRRKNLVGLAAAYAALTDEERRACPLVVVGGGEAIYRAQDIEWPAETVLAGYVSDEELATLYAEAKAIVFVSLAEGFGLPLVEATAAGATRLVVSDLPVFRWICGDGAEYVDPASPSSIAAGLRAVLDGSAPEAAIELGRFDWDASADTIRALTHKLARRNR